MAKEVQVPSATGQTLYGTVKNSAGQVWRPATSAFETYSAANWANYATAIALTEMGATGEYTGDFPTGITTAGTYAITVRVGASPAVSDTVISMGTINWNGASEETQANVPYAPTTVASSPTPTTTQFAGGSSLSSVDNAYSGQQCEMVTGASKGVRRTIIAYVGSTKLLTLESALPVAPSATDEFRII
jgi:hypothetical protein